MRPGIIRVGTLRGRVKPTTELYRAYLREAIEQMRGETAGLDWLEVSSQIVASLLRRHGYEPAWAQPVTWEAYAATRYEAVREQLRSVLNASRRRSGRFGPDDQGVAAERSEGPPRALAGSRSVGRRVPADRA